MKIFVASLYSSLVQCSTSNRDAILNDVQDDKTFLLTSDLCFQDDFSSQTYFGLSYTILISSSSTIPIITLFDHSRTSNILGLGHRPNSYSFNSIFWLTSPHNRPSKSCFSTPREERRILISPAHPVYGYTLSTRTPKCLFICSRHTPDASASKACYH